jgi:hypothetical protein
VVGAAAVAGAGIDLAPLTTGDLVARPRLARYGVGVGVGVGSGTGVTTGGGVSTGSVGSTLGVGSPLGLGTGVAVGFGFGVAVGFGVAAGLQPETPLPEDFPATAFGARNSSGGSVPGGGKSRSARARIAAKSARKM